MFQLYQEEVYKNHLRIILTYIQIDPQTYWMYLLLHLY